MSSKCARAIRLSMQDTTVVSTQKLVDLQNNNGTEDIDDNEMVFKSNKLFNNMAPQLHAYQYGSEFSKNPYLREVPHNIVATMDLSHLPRGTIFLFDANYMTTKKKNGAIDYHGSGHLGIGDGQGRESGGVYRKIVDKKQATHLRVFIPIKVGNVES